jgi:hypothetical protein
MDYRQEMIVELMGLLKPKVAPLGEGEWFKLICGVGFEPHGRASETWEVYWQIELPKTPWYWKSTNGWVKGNPNVHMKFHEKTLEGALAKALTFLQEVPNP